MSSSSGSSQEDAGELRKGPWTEEEDALLVGFISKHGDGRWNSLAKRAGLRRTGKSCRLRWLNYLNPEVKRGNLTPQEQLLILDLHSKWGNRWSKIAQFLPGRTDNEIKNYWRTRVQKQARHLKVDPNGAVFNDIVKCFFIPRLLEKVEGSLPDPPPSSEPAGANFSQNPQRFSDSVADYISPPPELLSEQGILAPALHEEQQNAGGCYDLAMEVNWVEDSLVEYGMWSMDELYDF
ncbi:unnamed protein product [Linum tenue]|uniref:Uncharacterized protein n=1 Tax=Linum tenue TaxID=586396 RepID=A0AAV0ITC2_9ROSI|nr:unnamed protein product [Linum tenue]